MKKNSAFFLLMFSVILISSNCNSGNHKRAKGKLPNFSLKDPRGKTFTSGEILKKGLVIVVTAPTLSNESAQNGWNEFLVKTMPKKKVTLLFLEDMSVSDFKKTALKDMKKDYVPGTPPLLLIDTNGDVRKKLGVEAGKTSVLVYNKKGKLIYTVNDKPSLKTAKIIWGKLK
ncbi:MAG: hypothetical protein ABIE74_08930 [Pseudomonadota bacterium]